MYLNSSQCQSDSLIGGLPFVPKGVAHPTNPDGVPFTFFFTVTYPTGHALEGNSLSLFCETQAFAESTLIPEMLPSHNARPVVPADYLHNYQRAFKAYFFKTRDGVLLNSSTEQIAKQYLTTSQTREQRAFGHIGNAPLWLSGDNSPGPCEREEPLFALQVFQNQTFPITALAPRQEEMCIFGGTQKRSSDDYYFFNMNEVYFFAYPNRLADRATYIITQCN